MHVRAHDGFSLDDLLELGPLGVLFVDEGDVAHLASLFGSSKNPSGRDALAVDAADVDVDVAGSLMSVTSVDEWVVLASESALAAASCPLD